jgi:molybdopterin-guanine dinucleotide biosynthesis protein A
VGAIFTALDAATADLVIAVAGDLPFLSADLLGELVRRAALADGAWVRTARGAEPLLACYRRTSQQALADAIAAGDLKAAHLDRRLTLTALDEDDLARFGPPDELLANINTPEDYARIQ